MAEGQTLIVGMTGTGKSTLLKQYIIPPWVAQGVPVIVCDLIGAKWDGASWATRDPRAFLAAVNGSQRIVGIVDEFYDVIGKDYNLSVECAPLATMARNFGNRMYFCTGRTNGVPPTYRNACREVYAFYQTPKDAAILVDNYGDEMLRETSTLKDGEVIHWRRGHGAYRTTIPF